MAVHAKDAVVRTGLLGFLRQDQQLLGIDTTTTATTTTKEADVVVVAVENADDSTLETLRGLRAHSGVSFLLIVKWQWRIEISAAVECGVRAVLSRSGFCPTEFTSRVLTVAREGGSFPRTLEDDLTSQIQKHQREVSAARQAPVCGATERERNVLRLLAEGCELAEIAIELCYSERTIKYVLHGITKRWGLRNRAHAVSYAIRTGLI